MTCIVGLQRGNKLYFGCDSSIVYGYKQMISNNSKLHRAKTTDGYSIVFGSAGSIPKSDIVESIKKFPKCGDLSALSYMKQKLAPFLRKKFHKISGETNFLVGFKSSLFEVNDDLSVCSVNDFWAIGSGADYALGALAYIYYNKTLSAKDSVVEALKIAQIFDVGTHEPFYTEII